MPDPDRSYNGCPNQTFTSLWIGAQHALGGFIRMHVRDHNQADDIIQEVARHATSSFDRYDPERPFIAWLIGIARQRIAEAHRDRSRRPLLFSSDLAESITAAYVELQSETSDRLEGLRQCMSKLSERHRRLIELRYSRRMTSAQIGEQIGGNASSVDVMLHRVRSALRDCVTRYLEAQR